MYEYRSRLVAEKKKAVNPLRRGEQEEAVARKEPSPVVVE